MLSAQPYVDAYSSATEQAMKSMLTGDAFKAAAKAIEAGSADLANLATSKAPGYTAPKSYLANVMSVNPDGSVGISTISTVAIHCLRLWRRPRDPSAHVGTECRQPRGSRP